MFFCYFDLLIIFFYQFLLQISFQTCENILGKFQGRTLTSVDAYTQYEKGQV